MGLVGELDILASLSILSFFVALSFLIFVILSLFVHFFLVAFAVKDGASWRGGKFDIKLIALHCLRPRPEMMT